VNSVEAALVDMLRAALEALLEEAAVRGAARAIDAKREGRPLDGVVIRTRRVLSPVQRERKRERDRRRRASQRAQFNTLRARAS
jgi:hypothetical protein